MPWRIEENHPDCDGFAVVRFDPETEEAIRVDGCHRTRQAAAEQMATLYAAEEEKSLKQASLTERVRKVERAAHEQLSAGAMVPLMVIEVFEDHLIARWDDRFVSIPYEINEDRDVVFAPRNDWQEVEERREWVAKMMEMKGRRLAALLNRLIEERIDDETSRADIVAELARAAGISTNTVNQILAGEIDRPPDNRLRGFARVLDVSFERLQRLADQDAGKSAEIKARAQARRPSFDGVENTPWERPDWADFVEGYRRHTDAEVEGTPRVSEAPAAMKRWAASKTLLGDENADTFDDLVVLPVVNPLTNRLNVNAVRAAIARAPQMEGVSERAIQSAQEMGRRLLEEVREEEKSVAGHLSEDTMVQFGEPLKTLRQEGTLVEVGAYGIRYGSPEEKDLVGDWFAPDTDYGPTAGDGTVAMFNHGQPVHKSLRHLAERTFSPVKTARDDIGIFVRHVLDIADEYERAVYELVKAGKLRWSSGTAAHLVLRDPASGKIKRWHPIEWSYTPSAAEPRLPPIAPLKSLMEARYPGLEASSSEDASGKDASSTATVQVSGNQKARIVIETTPHEHEGKNMDELIQEILAHERNPFSEERLKAMTEAELQQVKELMYQEAKSKADNVEDYAKDDEATKRLNSLEQVTKQLSEQISTLLEQMQESPAIRKAKYYTVDGGEADKEIKTFGDFLLAVMRHDTKRLHTVYKSTKDMSGVDGTSGGYLVPEEYGDRLFQVAADASIVRQRAFIYPAASSRGQIPALDQYTAPTAGQGDTAFAGGVVMTWSSEGATDGETQPNFALIDYNLNKLKAFTEVPNELIFDSSQSIDALLTRLFGVAIAGMEDYSFLRGDGVGKPLGILNADAAIAVNPDTNNVFAFADAAEMLSRFHPVAGGNPVWIMHRSTIPDLAAFEVSAGSGGVWMANLAEGIPQSLFGYPILYSEHLPQANNSGHVLLADLGAYAIFEPPGAQMSIAFSEHAAFTADKGTWRVVKRLDGQPWVKNAIPLADPQGSYTVSPFVYFND